MQDANKLALHPPPAYIVEINKLSNTVVSSATIALIRTLINPPKAAAEATEAAAANLPAWFQGEFKQKRTFQGFLGQVRVRRRCGEMQEWGKGSLSRRVWDFYLLRSTCLGTPPSMSMLHSSSL